MNTTNRDRSVATNTNGKAPNNTGAHRCSTNRKAVTTKEACELLGGISSRSLFRLEERGIIRSSKALRVKIWPITEIERFLEETL